MANEKIINARLQNKHDLEANWIKAGESEINPFVPKQGEIIVYDIEIDENNNILELPKDRTIPYTYERFKIGDGINNVIDLPFQSEVDYSQISFDTTELINYSNSGGSI